MNEWNRLNLWRHTWSYPVTFCYSLYGWMQYYYFEVGRQQLFHTSKWRIKMRGYRESYIPANTRRLRNVGLTLAHRLRSWPNNSTTLGKRLMFDGIYLFLLAKATTINVSALDRKTQEIHEGGRKKHLRKKSVALFLEKVMRATKFKKKSTNCFKKLPKKGKNVRTLNQCCSAIIAPSTTVVSHWYNAVDQRLASAGWTYIIVSYHVDFLEINLYDVWVWTPNTWHGFIVMAMPALGMPLFALGSSHVWPLGINNTCCQTRRDMMLVCQVNTSPAHIKVMSLVTSSCLIWPLSTIPAPSSELLSGNYIRAFMCRQVTLTWRQRRVASRGMLVMETTNRKTGACALPPPPPHPRRRKHRLQHFYVTFYHTLTQCCFNGGPAWWTVNQQ